MLKIKIYTQVSRNFTTSNVWMFFGKSKNKKLKYHEF